MIETWLLKTVDGRDVLMDSEGNCTLQGDGSNSRFEFRKDEHSGDNRQALAKKVSYLLGVDCVWLSNFMNPKKTLMAGPGMFPWIGRRITFRSLTTGNPRLLEINPIFWFPKAWRIYVYRSAAKDGWHSGIRFCAPPVADEWFRAGELRWTRLLVRGRPSGIRDPRSTNVACTQMAARRLLRRRADLAPDVRVDLRQHHPEQRTTEDIAGIVRAQIDARKGDQRCQPKEAARNAGIFSC
jgi:hypothetical protein